MQGGRTVQRSLGIMISIYSLSTRALESSWAQWLLPVISVENWESLAEHDEKKNTKYNKETNKKTTLHASVTRENSGLVVGPVGL